MAEYKEEDIDLNEGTDEIIEKNKEKQKKIEDPLKTTNEKKNEIIKSEDYENQLKEEERVRKQKKYDDTLSDAASNINYSQPEYIEVTVSNPELIDDSTGKYTVYTVTTRSSHHEYAPGEHLVKRRYNQFQSLRNQLKDFRDQTPQAKNWGKIPKLPGDTFKSYYIPGYRFKPEFTEQRAKDLTTFITTILKHPSYLFSDITIQFLTQKEFEIVKPKTKIVWGNGDESSSSSE